MDEETFNKQYDAAWANRLITDLKEAAYFQSLSAENLYVALCERMEEQMNLEESEIKTILCVIADRLGRLEEINSMNESSTGKCATCGGVVFLTQDGHTERHDIYGRYRQCDGSGKPPRPPYRQPLRIRLKNEEGDAATQKEGK